MNNVLSGETSVTACGERMKAKRPYRLADVHLILFPDSVDEHMRERVSRHDDEGLYQPRIHSRWIRELYAIGQETGIPITVLLDQALREFVIGYGSSQGKNPEQPSSQDPHEIGADARDASSDGHRCSARGTDNK